MLDIGPYQVCESKLAGRPAGARSRTGLSLEPGARGELNTRKSIIFTASRFPTTTIGCDEVGYAATIRYGNTRQAGPLFDNPKASMQIGSLQKAHNAGDPK